MLIEWKNESVWFFVLIRCFLVICSTLICNSLLVHEDMEVSIGWAMEGCVLPRDFSQSWSWCTIVPSFFEGFNYMYSILNGCEVFPFLNFFLFKSLFLFSSKSASSMWGMTSIREGECERWESWKRFTSVLQFFFPKKHDLGHIVDESLLTAFTLIWYQIWHCYIHIRVMLNSQVN